MKGRTGLTFYSGTSGLNVSTPLFPLTSKKLQFVVVTQSTPAVLISLCITVSLFLSVSNANILLQVEYERNSEIRTAHYNYNNLRLGLFLR